MNIREEISDNMLEQVVGGAPGIGGNDEVKLRVISIIRNQLDLNHINIQGTSSLVGDLGADSLDVVDVVQALEEEFKVTLPEPRVFAAKTVDDFCNLIDEMLNP